MNNPVGGCRAMLLACVLSLPLWCAAAWLVLAIVGR